MEDENENENNNSFISIFGSDNIITEKSFSKDFNNEKNTISYLDSNYFFNDYNNESKPTNDETNLSEQNKINLFENEKKLKFFLILMNLIHMKIWKKNQIKFILK